MAFVLFFGIYGNKELNAPFRYSFVKFGIFYHILSNTTLLANIGMYSNSKLHLHFSATTFMLLLIIKSYYYGKIKKLYQT
jgi:hypothetical protein